MVFPFNNHLVWMSHTVSPFKTGAKGDLGVSKTA